MTTHTLTGTEQAPAPAGPDAHAPVHAVSVGFQCRTIVRLAAAMVCGAAIAGATVYALLVSDLVGYAENMAILSSVREWVVGAAVLSALIQIALTGAMAAVLALLASHKIAGPTIRLIRHLRDVGNGVLPGSVRFRRGDQVGKLEGQFNDVSRLLAERHARLQRKLDEVRAAEQALRRASPAPEAAEERRAAAGELRERADEMAGLLAAVGGTAECASTS